MADRTTTDPGSDRLAVDTAVAERLARRYPPPRLPRPLVVAVVAILAVVGIGWTVWVGLDHATPGVSGRLDTYEVLSDTEVTFTLTVERSDPSVPATCRVIAQAENRERVGELNLELPAGDRALVRSEHRMKTFRPAVSVSIDGCVTA